MKHGRRVAPPNAELVVSHLQQWKRWGDAIAKRASERLLWPLSVSAEEGERGDLIAVVVERAAPRKERSDRGQNNVGPNDMVLLPHGVPYTPQ